MQALSVRPADNACRDAAADRYRDRRTGVETVDEEGIARVCPFDPIVRNSRACLLLVNYPRCACLRTTSTSLPTKYAGSPLSHTYVRCRARRRVLTRCIVRIYIRRDMLVFKATNLIQSLSSLPRCLRDRGSWSLPLNRHRGGISIQRQTHKAAKGLSASADFRSLEQSRPGTVTCRSFVYGGYCAGIEFSKLALNSRFSLAVST